MIALNIKFKHHYPWDWFAPILTNVLKTDKETLPIILNYPYHIRENDQYGIDSIIFFRTEGEMIKRLHG